MNQENKLKRIGIICSFPYGLASSHRFRFEQYIPALESRGFFVNQLSFYDLKTHDILYFKGNVFGKALGVIKGYLKRFVHLITVWNYDYVLIHREATPLGPPWFEWLIAKFSKAKIIYDFDDSIWIEVTSKENAFVSKLKWAQKVPLTCTLSYKIAPGNDFLAEYCRKLNPRVVVNPTTIDTDYHLLKPNFGSGSSSGDLTIGWTGSHSTLRYLDAVATVIDRLSQQYKFRFLVIADRPPPQPILDKLSNTEVDFCKWSIETEIEDLQKIDIGIMPLFESEWEQGKCGFKALQYMAIGAPAIVSPVGVNADIVRDGIDGYLCSTDEQWSNALEKLISDEQLRDKMGKSGRQRIIDSYSVQSNTENFVGLFS